MQFHSLRRPTDRKDLAQMIIELLRKKIDLLPGEKGKFKLPLAIVCGQAGVPAPPVRHSSFKTTRLPERDSSGNGIPICSHFNPTTTTTTTTKRLPGGIISRVHLGPIPFRRPLGTSRAPWRRRRRRGLVCANGLDLTPGVVVVTRARGATPAGN